MPVAFALMIAAGTFYSKAAVANPFYENVMKCSEPGKKNLKGCLNDFLKYHCLDLSWKNWGSYWACNSTVDQFLDLLDLEQLKIDWVEETGGLSLHEVIFADRTSQIFLTDSKLESTLTTLNAEFDDSYRFSRKHSLWDTISQLKNNQFGDTLEYLAVVFQDIAAKADQSGSPTLHFPLYKMEKLGNALPDGAIKNQLGRNLRAYRDLMEPWTRFKVKENVNDTYFFYPEIPHRDEMDQMLHHFYVPAYLSYLLEKKGVSKSMAFFVPFMFNTLYELKKIDKKLNQGRWPFRYTTPIKNAADLQKVDLNIRKIYTAYLGALYGLHLEKQAHSYAVFSKYFANDPYGFMQKALKVKFQ